MTLRLAAVFAHPDDDTHGVGGSVAKYSDQLEYTVVVVTSGEAGQIADPSLATPATLGSVREEEERKAIEILGPQTTSVRFLRYPDGGVPAVPRDELVGAIVRALRQARPQVVVTFGPEGITKHEDHIAVSQAATEAFHELRAGEDGDAFQRLLYSSIPQSAMDLFWRLLKEKGVDLGDPEGPFMPRGVPDHTITVRVDCSDVMDKKREALMAHRTQADEWAALPQEVRDLVDSQEWFVMAWPPVTEPSGPTLAGVFEGLDST